MRLAFAGMVLALAAHADVITLKSGRIINGTYIGGTPRQIRVEVGDAIETYDVSDIVRIEFSNGASSSRSNSSSAAMIAPLCAARIGGPAAGERSGHDPARSFGPADAGWSGRRRRLRLESRPSDTAAQHGFGFGFGFRKHEREFVIERRRWTPDLAARAGFGRGSFGATAAKAKPAAAAAGRGARRVA